MLITRKHSKSRQPPPLLLDGTILAQISSYKYLGITITKVHQTYLGPLTSAIFAIRQ